MFPLPTIDARQPGRASELIKRFQAQLDANVNNDATPPPVRMSRTSSASSQSEHRQSQSVSDADAETTTTTAQAIETTGVRNESEPESALRRPDSAQSGARPVSPPSGGETPSRLADALETKSVDDQLHLRSAGLPAPPPVPKDVAGHKNARDAFPDMQAAPESSLAEERDLAASDGSWASETKEVEIAESGHELPAADASANGYVDGDASAQKQPFDGGAVADTPEKPLPALPHPSPRSDSKVAAHEDGAASRSSATESTSPSSSEQLAAALPRLPTPKVPATRPTPSRSSSSGATSPAATSHTPSRRLSPETARKAASPTSSATPSPRVRSPANGSRPASVSPSNSRSGTTRTPGRDPLAASQTCAVRSDAANVSASGDAKAPAKSRGTRAPTTVNASSASRLTSPTASSLAKARTPASPSPSPEMTRSRSGGRKSTSPTQTRNAMSVSSGTPSRSPLTLRGGTGAGGPPASVGPSSPSVATPSAPTDAAPLAAGQRKLRLGLAAAGRAQPATVSTSDVQPAGPAAPVNVPSSSASPEEPDSDGTPAAEGGREQKVFQGMPPGRPHGKIGIPVTFPEGPDGPMKAFKADEVEDAGKRAQADREKEDQ